MKLFKEYLSESTQSYDFVIKFAEKPTDDQVNIIETWLKKYDLHSFTSPVLEENSQRDFIDIPNRQVYMIEVTLGQPVSSYILLQDLKTAANISEKLMAVRSITEPIERYSNFNSWSRSEDTKESDDGFESSARLSTNREYFPEEQPQAEPLFGNEYNKKLLSYLAGVSATRPTMKVDPPAPLFDWLKMDAVGPGEPAQDVSDFNSHYDTPKPVSEVSSDIPPVDKKFMNIHGGMSDTAVPSVKFYKNKAGVQKQVAKPVPERK